MNKKIKKTLILFLAAVSFSTTVPSYAATISSKEYNNVIKTASVSNSMYVVITKTFPNLNSIPDRIYYKETNSGRKYSGYIYKKSISKTSDGKYKVTFKGTLYC